MAGQSKLFHCTSGTQTAEDRRSCMASVDVLLLELNKIIYSEFLVDST